MKKIISLVVGAAFISAALTSCQPEQVAAPDGVAQIKSMVLTAELNPALGADVVGAIDPAAMTVTFVIPESVAERSFIPTFELSQDDVLNVGEEKIESGVSSIVVDGATFVVVDEKSDVSATYSSVKVADDAKAGLVSFVIAAADNSGLIDADVVPEAIAPEMIVRVPGKAFRQELKIAFTATANDVIEVNGTAVEAGAAVSVDTAFPVDVEVTDAVAGKSEKYVIKVGKILQMNVLTLGTYANNTETVALQDYVALAVDQKNNVPYIFTTENVTNEAGTVVKNRPTVLKYENEALTVVGEPNFNDKAATYGLIDVIDGKPYVAFVDAGAPTANRISSMSFDGSKWDYVGERGFGAKISGLSYYRIGMILDPVTKYPIVGETTNEALNGLAKRDLAVSVFNGSAWDANKPVNGRDQHYCYNVKLARSADAVYLLAANQTEKTFSLYQYKSGSWSVLVADLKIEGTTDICTYFADLEVAPDGTVYAAVGDNSSGNYLCQLYKYDASKKELVVAANPLPGSVFDKSSCQWDLTFDANGNPVVAVIDVTGDDVFTAKLFTVDTETKNWAEPYVFSAEPAGCYMAAGRADNGDVYVAYSTKDAEKVCTVSLYKYCLEDDILPE